jgi:hypothetical protein
MAAHPSAVPTLWVYMIAEYLDDDDSFDETNSFVRNVLVPTEAQRRAFDQALENCTETYARGDFATFTRENLKVLIDMVHTVDCTDINRRSQLTHKLQSKLAALQARASSRR